MKRAYFMEGVFAGKAWGKTTYLARRAHYEARHPSVSTVLIVDPPDSFRDVASNVAWPRWTSWPDFVDGIEARDGRVPRVNVFCFGADPVDVPKYKPVMDFAVGLGDTVLIVDEVQLFAPKGRKGMAELTKIAAMGRHLPCGDGSERQTCLIVASQTWTGVNLEIRNQIHTVVCGRMAGRANHAMLEAEVHEKAREILSGLAPHKWVVLSPPNAPLPPMSPRASIA